jgi:hypothetical protein
MVDCPRCGWTNCIDWKPGTCTSCGLAYSVAQEGETWSGEEYPIPIWAEFKKQETHRYTIYLKNGNTVTGLTYDPEEIIRSLKGYIDRFFRRGLFRQENSVVRFNGTPIVCIPIEHINFYSIEPVVKPTRT